MEANKTALERAFELARSGQFGTVEEVRRKVSSEGYLQTQLEGRALFKQLKALIAAARVG